MRLSTRLLLPLLATVVAVMTVYALSALRQREMALQAEGRRATHAYAYALGLALEGAFRSPDLVSVQEVVDRISREPEIYGVLVYGPDGRILFASDLLRDAPSPPQVVREALARDGPLSFERVVAEQGVFSVVRPLRDPAGETIGGYEVAQPLVFLEREQRSTQRRILLYTMALLVAVTGVILWLVRRMIARPLGELVAAAQALGRGELGHRIHIDARAGELAELGAEFNRMADRLESARTELLTETAERLALEQRLRQTDKLAAVGNLAAGLAHEIAAPLNVVAGRAELLLKRDMEPEAKERNLRIIIDQIGRITLIMRNLLDFARRREPRLRPHTLKEVLDSALELLEAEFDRARVEIRKEVPDDLWVRADPNLLHQVFVNLLLNALHALERVTTRRRIYIRAARVASGGRGETVEVELRDTGPGIPPGSLPQIFEPFFTTKPGGEGTGLGLAVARGIIEEHQGSIRAENWDGGALFHISLPGESDMEASIA